MKFEQMWSAGRVNSDAPQMLTCDPIAQHAFSNQERTGPTLLHTAFNFYPQNHLLGLNTVPCLRRIESAASQEYGVMRSIGSCKRHTLSEVILRWLMLVMDWMVSWGATFSGKIWDLSNSIWCQMGLMKAANTREFGLEDSPEWHCACFTQTRCICSWILLKITITWAVHIPINLEVNVQIQMSSL